MVEVIGDIVAPIALIAPARLVPKTQKMSGADIFVSGAKLYYTVGSATQLITSA